MAASTVNNRCVLFKPLKFVVICYGGCRKLIHLASKQCSFLPSSSSDFSQKPCEPQTVSVLSFQRTKQRRRWNLNPGPSACGSGLCHSGTKAGAQNRTLTLGGGIRAIRTGVRSCLGWLHPCLLMSRGQLPCSPQALPAGAPPRGSGPWDAPWSS